MSTYIHYQLFLRSLRDSPPGTVSQTRKDTIQMMQVALSPPPPPPPYLYLNHTTPNPNPLSSGFLSALISLFVNCLPAPKANLVFTLAFPQACGWLWPSSEQHWAGRLGSGRFMDWGVINISSKSPESLGPGLPPTKCRSGN